jgi:hypothetical protein
MDTVFKTKAQRLELYRAVKYQVEEYAADCGYTLPQLWAKIHENTEAGKFWRRTVCVDYREMLRASK